MCWRAWVPFGAGCPHMAPDQVAGLPGQPGPDAPAVYRERGYYMTEIGYRSAPWLTHTNDDYVRTPASPTLDRAWQGVQKENALALLQYASRHPGWGPDVPGTRPQDSPYTGNTMRWLAARTPTINKNPAPSYGDVGPGLSWMPNPTAPGSLAIDSADAAQPPGLLGSILRRLGVGGG